ncbi:integral membrane family protein [Seiridium cupressi]
MPFYRDSIIAALVVFLVLDGAAMAGRVFVRTKLITRGFGYDDAALCLTFLGYIFVCATCWTSMAYGFGAEDEQPYYDKRKATQYYFATQLCCYISSGLVKLAVALVLIRLANTKILRWLLYISIVICAIWTVVMTLFTSWLCASSGTSNYAGSQTCGVVGQFRTISNIFIDYFYALLPVYMLWKVQMGLRIKITAMFLLSLGIFASSATIVKLVIITRLRTAEGKEEEDLHYQLLLWAINELGLAIFAASAAALRPLLLHYSALFGSIYGRSHNKSHNSNSDATGPYQVFDASYEMSRQSSKPQSKHLDENSWAEPGKGISTERLAHVHDSSV